MLAGVKRKRSADSMVFWNMLETGERGGRAEHRRRWRGCVDSDNLSHDATKRVILIRSMLNE